MDTKYTIGKLAKAAGVPASTVRYYERTGLLRPSARSPHNYRLYSTSALHRLRFIRAAQASGFTLHDTAILLGLNDGSTSPCREVQELIEKRLAEVKSRVHDLRLVQDKLATALVQCRHGAEAGTCQVIDHLHTANVASAADQKNQRKTKKSRI